MIRYCFLALIVGAGCDRAPESSASSKDNQGVLPGGKPSTPSAGSSEVLPRVSGAKKAFEEYLLLKGMDLKGLVPEQAVEAMIGFYIQRRFKGCTIANDEDMLLYQWGTYNWGSGENFEFNITRQFIVAAEGDDGMYQLSLTIYYTPTNELRGIKSGNKWCGTPDQVSGFREFIRKSEAYQKASVVKPKDVTVNMEKV